MTRVLVKKPTIAPPVRTMSLEDRLKASVRKAMPDANMHPDGMREEVAAPPPKDEPEVKDLKEMITTPVDYLKAKALLLEMTDIKAQLKPLKAREKAITPKIKNLLGKHDVGKSRFEGWTVSYFDAPRSTLSKDLLIAAGVSPLTIMKCTITKPTYTLKLTPPGVEEEDDE